MFEQIIAGQDKINKVCLAGTLRRKRFWDGFLLLWAFRRVFRQENPVLTATADEDFKISGG